MNYRFCPDCGREGSVEALDKNHARCSNCGWEAWNNPKATVAVIIYGW